MPQDSINDACISNNGDNLHLRAAGTQHGIYFKNLGKQARPRAASFLGELRVLVGPGGLWCGASEILRHSGGYSRPVAIGSIRASSMLAAIGDVGGYVLSCCNAFLAKKLEESVPYLCNTFILRRLEILR